MTYKIAQNAPAKMKTADLLAELDGFKQLAIEVTERLSAILVELRSRRESHAFFSHPVLRFFESIADESLNAEAAIILANGPMIKAVMHLPHDQQLAVARGQDIAVAVIQPSGQMANENLPIQRMGPDLLKRVFGDQGIRSVAAQSAIIRQNSKTERYGMVTVLQDETMLKIGNQKITPEDLRGPLLALGYTLELSRIAERKAG